MSAASLVQLVSACIGIVGSFFFAIGVMRQTVEAMARLSGTYWDWNPHMPPALAAQKADYLFGGGLILAAFLLQLASFFAPSAPFLTEEQARLAPWVASVSTIFSFFVLRLTAKRLAEHYQTQISAWLKCRAENWKRKSALPSKHVPIRSTEALRPSQFRRWRRTETKAVQWEEMTVCSVKAISTPR